MDEEDESTDGWEAVFRAERNKLGEQGSRVHHWWPRGIQKHWAYQEKINSLDCEGRRKSISVKNDSIAKIDHGHTVRYGSENKGNDPFFGKVNYEPLFKEVDDRGASLVKQVEGVSFNGMKLKEKIGYIYFLYRGLPDRLQAYASKKLTSREGRDLVRLLLSIHVRSPGYRHRYDSSINRFWGRNLSREQVKPITAHNLVRDWRGACQALDSTQQKFRISLLTSLRKKFDFPDGFPCTVSFDRCLESGFLAGDLLMPLTPDICILIEFHCGERQEACTKITSGIVHDDIVLTINEAFQHTAKQQIFFYRDPPNLSDAFRSGVPAPVRPASLGLGELLEPFRA